MKGPWLRIITVLILGAAVSAQEFGPPPPGPPRHEGFGLGGPHFGMHPWKVVTGAPYSATVTEERAQTLAGGNAIHVTTTAQVARDSQGRTYSRETIGRGMFGSSGDQKTVIFISDTTSNYTYTLHPDTKTAVRRIMKIRPGNPPEAAADGPPDRFRSRAGETNPNVKITTTAGTYQGLDVEIKTITRTIPAGEIGNSQPIVSTTTIYYSPALQTVVYSTRNDPRFGESKMSLSNISRSEPDPKLFVVPSDYRVQDATEFRPGGPQ